MFTKTQITVDSDRINSMEDIMKRWSSLDSSTVLGIKKEENNEIEKVIIILLFTIIYYFKIQNCKLFF